METFCFYRAFYFSYVDAILQLEVRQVRCI